MLKEENSVVNGHMTANQWGKLARRHPWNLTDTISVDRSDFKSQNCAGSHNQPGFFSFLTRTKKKYTGSDLSLAAAAAAAAAAKETGLCCSSGRGTFYQEAGWRFPH